ncbi:hypothetical protein GVAV_001669 [Gurleya vavrai]
MLIPVEGNIYVGNPQPDNILENPSIITDNGIIKQTNTQFYIFKFTTGKETLPFFKKLISTKNYKIIIIYTFNFELFNEKFAIFRFLDFKFYYEECKFVEKNEYLKFERMMRKKYKLKYNTEILKRGNEISYRPDIMASVRNSLKRPKKYLFDKKCEVSVVFKNLENGPKSLVDLKKLEIGNVEDVLKSLIYAEIVGVKKDKFFLKM